jgi:hypothetical protein
MGFHATKRKVANLVNNQQSSCQNVAPQILIKTFLFSGNDKLQHHASSGNEVRFMSWPTFL